MSASRQGNSSFIDGIKNHSLNLNILWDNLKLSAQNLGNGNYFISYDNDPKHTTLNVCLWHLNNCPQVLKTSPQLPDLNSIEQIWRELQVRVQKHDIKTKSKLKPVKLRSDEAAFAI